MGLYRCLFLFFSFFLSLITLVNCNDRFTEELYIKPLPSGHVYSYFQFTTVWDVDDEDLTYQHCHLFPRGLGEIIGRYNVEELHISLTEGLWRYENWGYPALDASPGAEIWAWFKEGTQNVDDTWKKLTATLSGLLCASLNFIETANTMSPEFSFRPAGILRGNLSSSRLRYATLPQEIVCTENLTPWKKLLPCDSKKGLATLLNAGSIYNTNYHSIGIHLRNICRDKNCEELSIELKQTVSLVYDLVILDSSTNNYSIRKLFGSGLSGFCPLASSSNIYIDITSNNTDGRFNLIPPPPSKITSNRGGYTTELAVYDVKKLNISHMINIAVTYTGSKVYNLKKPPVLYVSRYIIGYGQEKGGFVIQLHNKHWQPIDAIILENIPWFVPIYLHTLKIQANGQDIKPNALKYVPGNQRQNPYYLEMVVTLPPRAMTTIMIELDYVFLKWQEYPPDANHGFYIGSAVITAMLPLAKNYTAIPQDVSYIYTSFNESREYYPVHLRTESIIITLPTPDFSMPYNVICLACTVIALAFGPIHNITTKRLRAKEAKKSKGLIAVVINKVKGIFCTAAKKDQGDGDKKNS